MFVKKMEGLSCPKQSESNLFVTVLKLSIDCHSFRLFRAGNVSTLLGNKVPLGIQNSYLPVQWSSIKNEQKKLPTKLLTFYTFLDSKEEQLGTLSKNSRQSFQNCKLRDHQSEEEKKLLR